MSVFKAFEREAVRRLAEESACALNIEGILSDSEFVSLEHTGVGYFLTAAHPALPEERIVWDGVLLLGCSNGIECGFVVFIEEGALCLECHSWGDQGIPEDYRNGEVSVEVVKGKQTAAKLGKLRRKQEVRARDWIAVLLLSPMGLLVSYIVGNSLMLIAHSAPVGQEQLESFVGLVSFCLAPASFVCIGFLVGGAGRWKWSIITSYIEGVGFALLFAFGFTVGEGPLWKEFFMASIVGGIVGGLLWRRRVLEEAH